MLTRSSDDVCAEHAYQEVSESLFHGVYQAPG